MSSYSETHSYNLDPRALGDAIVTSGQAAGLREKSRAEGLVLISEPFGLKILISFGWPATVSATLRPADGKTAVDYKVSNFGFGPIQTNHCKKVLKKVTDALADREAKG